MSSVPARIALDAGPGSVQLFAEATMFDEIPSLMKLSALSAKGAGPVLGFQQQKASLVFVGDISLHLLEAATRYGADVEGLKR